MGFLDATNPGSGEAWNRLLFDHHEDTYESHLSSKGAHPTLKIHHPESRWVPMLLPDIYHGPAYPHEGYDGLTGDLSIFLALIAFSMSPHRLATEVPNMVEDGEWTTHDRSHGSKFNPKSTCS
jgi:hypothetical protein